jgi:hypothetical protein
MSKFWNRHEEDAVERLLRSNRPEPRVEFRIDILAQLAPDRQQVRPHVVGGRILLAILITALVGGAAVAAGGIEAAKDGANGIANVASQAFSTTPNGGASELSGSLGARNGNGGPGDEGAGNEVGPGDDEFRITTCLATGSPFVPFIQLTLDAVPTNFILAHFPGSFRGPPQGCPRPRFSFFDNG